MLEFLFGAVIGVWAAQQFTLPSVQQVVRNWWSKPAVPEETETETEAETFSGPMPEL
jgi:hypothetical protein|tara:strand:+ start:537 stop:707 length:171 start_codon:yes stop_codon:yes gene_type:complete